MGHWPLARNAMTIVFQNVTKIAQEAVKRRFGHRFGVSAIEGTPSAYYALEKIEPDEWRFFSADDPDARHVGGSQCVAIHRQTGRVLFLGIVGE